MMSKQLDDLQNDNEKKKRLSGLITAKVKEGNNFIESMIKPLSIGICCLYHICNEQLGSYVFEIF